MEEIAEISEKSTPFYMNPKRMSRTKDTNKNSTLPFTNFDGELVFPIHQKNNKASTVQLLNTQFKQKEKIRTHHFCHTLTNYNKKTNTERVNVESSKIRRNNGKSERLVNPTCFVWQNVSYGKSSGLRFSQNLENKRYQKSKMFRDSQKRLNRTGYKHNKTCQIHSFEPKGYKRRQRRLKFDKNIIDDIFSRYSRKDAKTKENLYNVVHLMTSALSNKLHINHEVGQSKTKILK